MSYWQSKVAIVTGGSSGLGLAIARQLFAAGSTVVLAARDAERLKTAADRVRGQTTELTIGPVKGSGIERGARWAFLAISQDDQSRHCRSTLTASDNWMCWSTASGKSGRGSARPRGRFRDVELNFLALSLHPAPQLLKRGHLVNIGSWRPVGGEVSRGVSGKFAMPPPQQLRLEQFSVCVLLVCPGPLKRDSEHADGWCCWRLPGNRGGGAPRP
jgi:hypothetical protein